MALHVELYTRSGCHLCEDALEVLRRHRIEPRLVDVDRDPNLQVRYGSCVPVVLVNGRIRFRGRVNEVLLRRLVRRESASGPP